jgi:hypothetical protein
MRRHLVNSTISLLSVLVATGCAEKVDTSKNLQEAPSAIARILGPALLDDCPQGGVEMEYGIDSNASGVLDDEEVNGSYSICHGEAGLEGAPGEACYAVEQEGEVYVLQCPGQEAVPLPAGPPGQAGVTGETGMPGEQGMDGANGLQVLVVTADEPWGETCPSGGVRIHSGLDTNGNGVLDADEVTENNAVCHGAQGEKGDQGDQGDKGEPGETGKQGPPGMDGLNGKDGETGKQGPLGMDGKVGEDGAPGKQGPPGLDGFNGADGEPGTDGLNGKDGATGEQGPPGLEGPYGEPGINGLNGKDGAKGDQGLPGADGLSGNDGKDGLPGPPGTVGEAGPPGENGLPGTHGTNGAKGDTGLPGADGKDGQDGLPGADGLSGNDGKDGLPGPSGTVGEAGPPGQNGLPGTHGTNGAKGDTGPAGPPGPAGAGAGASVLYLYGCSGNEHALMNPPGVCPDGWTEANYKSVHSGTSSNYYKWNKIRTCYRMDKACSSMYLYGNNQQANSCPSGWTDANYRIFFSGYGSNGKYDNVIRSCFYCP